MPSGCTHPALAGVLHPFAKTDRQPLELWERWLATEADGETNQHDCADVDPERNGNGTGAPTAQWYRVRHLASGVTNA